MIQYLMTPLDEQYDDGFGAIAEAFKEAATILPRENPKPAFFGHPHRASSSVMQSNSF